MQQQRSADFREITKMSRLRGVLLLCLLTTLVLTSISFAQKTTGTIRGTVTDPSDAVLSGATVTVTNTSTGLTRTVTTNASGEYVVADLPPGNYNISFAAAGFKEFTSQNVALNVASTYLQNAKLVVGSASDQVNVEANAIQVDTTSGEVSEVVTGQQVRELPLNGRSFVQLTQLQPGVSPANNFDSKNKGLLAGVDFSVNGNATTNNLYLIDGANNNDVGSNRTILIYPSVDAIAEFKMLRNAYGAEYGQASGGVINIITQGGTNNWHGGVFYFGRNDALNATEYFAKRAGTKDKLRRNDWGYKIGGPILKDKLFFFWNQEWNRELRGATRSACVPTALEKVGDFSEFAGQANAGCGAPFPHLPGTSTPLVDITSQVGAPSTGGLLLAQLFPDPNLSTPLSNGDNWAVSLASPIRWRQENVRVDFNLNKSNTVMGRFTQDTWTNAFPNTLGLWGDDRFPAVEGDWAQPAKQIVGKWTSTLSSSWVNDAEFAYSNNRINIAVSGENPGLLDQISEAIPPYWDRSLKTSPVGMPTFWGGFSQYGNYDNIWEIAPWHNDHDIYTVRDDMSKVVGNHTIKAGFFAGWVGKNEWAGATSTEYLTGGTADWATQQATGNPLANVLYPNAIWTGFSEPSTNTIVKLRWRDYEFYAADTFKVRPNLTLDFGVRYSWMPAPFHPEGRFTSFNPSLYDPTKPASDACNGLFVVPGEDPCGESNQQFGTAFSSGTPGVNRSLVETNKTMIAPRIGINWDPMGDGNTSVRAGFGQFFQRDRASTSFIQSNNAPFALNASGFQRTLEANIPCPTCNPSTSPAGGRDPSDTVPYSLQWNLSVERGLTRDTTIELGYVGNRAVHQTRGYDINQVDPSDWTTTAFIPSANVNPYRPFSNFGQLGWWTHDGDATYHALQALLRTKWRRNTLNVAYTWSHSIANIDLENSNGNPIGDQSSTYANDPDYDFGNSAINRPHIFVANLITFLPTFSGSNPFVKNAFGGWEFGVISTLASGTSITPLQNGVSENTNNVPASDPSRGTLTGLIGSGTNNMVRPDLAGNGLECATGRGFQLLDPESLTLIGHAIGTPGNAPRGFCHGPALVNTDFALYKNFEVPFVQNERMQIQFRLEMFNVFNTANYRGDQINRTFGANVNCGPEISAGMYNACSPTNNVISNYEVTSNFGQARQTRGAREIQYALKLTF
jgi:hypothetical protein